MQEKTEKSQEDLIGVQEENTIKEELTVDTDTLVSTEADQNIDYKRKYEDIYDKYLRAQSDLLNQKQSYDNEVSKIRKYSLQSFVNTILPAIDNLDLAVRYAPKDNTLYSGVLLTIAALFKAMSDSNVSYVKPKCGDKFDSDVHQVIHIEDTNNSDLDNTISILHVQGYRIYDRVIRPAQVSIFKIKK